MPVEMPGGWGRGEGGGRGWRLSGISRCAEKSEHMAVTGGIWPRFLHQDGCQTKATCVTGWRRGGGGGSSINTRLEH